MFRTKNDLIVLRDVVILTESLCTSLSTTFFERSNAPHVSRDVWRPSEPGHVNPIAPSTFTTVAPRPRLRPHFSLRQRQFAERFVVASEPLLLSLDESCGVLVVH